MRADRLISILFALQQGAVVTVRELAERLEVSPRTVTRDLEALSSSGVPVYAERGYGGGWRLAEGFRAKFNGLKRADVERLLLARSSSARLFADLGREKEFGETWDKLLQAATSGAADDASAVRERIHVDGAGWRKSFEALPWLPILYDAVWENRTLAMRYGRDENERELRPLGLVAKGQTWYVVGGAAGELKTYRVSRIAALRETGETFERPAGFDLETYWQESMASFRERLPTYPVRLRLTEEAYGRLKDMRFVIVAEVRIVRAEGESEAASDRDTGLPAIRGSGLDAERGADANSNNGGEPNEAQDDRQHAARGDWPNAARGSSTNIYEATVDLQTPEYAVDCLLRLGGDGAELLDPPELRAAMSEAVRRLAEVYLK